MIRHHHYRSLFIMAGLSLVSMFVLMYAMVNTFVNVYANVNQLYMAGLMTAPMILIELAIMRSMYKDKRKNLIVASAAVVAGVLFWTGIRQQAAVTDTQFLRSMIPHHASAILMCEQAPLRSDEARRLCQEIISSQQREIAQMKALLKAN